MSKKKYKQAIPNTATESIPYNLVYENGIIELQPGRYSKSYLIPEVNFKTSSQKNQWDLVQKYSEFLGSIDPNIDIQLTLYNRTIDVAQFQEEVLLEMRADDLNHYREEYNEMLLEKMVGAKNNLQTVKIITFTVETNGIDAAVEQFAQLDTILTDNMTQMTKCDVTPLTLIERLEILNAIYNQESTVPLYQKKIIDGHKSESFSLENCAAQGITIKDVIAPAYLSFNKEYIEIGNTIANCYYISNYPTWLKGTVLTDFASLSANMLVTVNFNVIPQEEAIKMVKNQRTNIGARLVQIQKKSAKDGIDASLISPELTEDKNEATNLMGTITKDNGHLFTATTIITLFAPDRESMKQFEKQLNAIAAKHLVTVKPLGKLKEHGFNSSLPLGNNTLHLQRLMTSHTVAAMNPFTVKEIRQKNGIYYGLNASSRNMIRYDRTSDMNPNAIILGMPGAGKSFRAKEEICAVLLSTGARISKGFIEEAKDEVYILDPENEYCRLTEAFGGAEVKVANGSNVYINPFDLNIENSADGEDPVKVKTDFIESICEIAIGGRYGLSPTQISIINRCVMKIYEPYLEHLKAKGMTIDTNACPTMENFYYELLEQPQAEAQELALSLEQYVKGAKDIFSHHTNVEIENRFIVFNIKDLGSGLKELGMHICLDYIWNRMILNKSKGKRTWIYLDEFHTLMQKPTSAAYISQIWKRARKWSGIPTASAICSATGLK